ncbi:hypothetical protein CI109_100007 [Kwoniella shandongensis]|uniref:Uncharacterized protein n=1 Tax=Kwoniella shandongensis TaxID=1734106 RepID=A0A5M6BUM7_9TREE|nr:uncharacterized protein CI109_006020 [Kwoniella shandongensis]KAA5525712.1 hypothetical protein CI109_006020 [Kwoniella shandongensis]
MTMAAQPPSSPFTFPTPSSSSFITPSKKRRAASPPPFPSPFGTTAPPSPWATTSNNPQPSPANPDDTPHRDKRRRPNLANGFSSLSISPNLEQTSRDQLPPTHDNFDHDDDEGIGLTPHTDRNDLRVEILPEVTVPQHNSHNHHHHSTRHHWSIPNHAGPSSSSSSTSPTGSSEENYDSDATYTRTRHGRYAGVAQQADEVVQPSDPASARTSPLGTTSTELGVEDVTVSPGVRRRRSQEDAEYEDRMNKRQRSAGGMDVDMNGGQPGDEEENIEEISSSRNTRRRGKTVWYEPEKDRIVITALSDSSRSSSRSPSPDSIENHLSQPGSQGFTLSPSLLTHLLKTQRDKLNGPLGDMLKNDKSLILYKPLGIHPGGWTEPVVKSWESHEEDSGRFEEIPEDEQFPDSVSAAHTDADMEVEGGQQAWDGDVDMAMDVE